MSHVKSRCPYKLKPDQIPVHQDAVDRLEKFTMPPLQLGNPDCVRYATRLDGPNVPVTVSEAFFSKGKRKRKRKPKKSKNRGKSKRKKTRRVKRKRKTRRKKRSRRKK